ncbi:MAG TPA: hypothetical protein VFG68_06330 [Fimbriiglobus sp.]|nr:hypothetical protein [Fimbriiglobus sp.]
MAMAQLEVTVSTLVRQLLDLFDALPDPDKRAAAVEIIHRMPDGDLPAGTLDALADELFVALDTEEAARAPGR